MSIKSKLLNILAVVAVLCASLPGRAQTAIPGFGTYVYDPSGNITAIGTDAFTYDEFGRLQTAAVDAHTQSYTYDRYGNILSITTDGTQVRRPGVNPLTNRADTGGGDNNIVMTYDPAGNVLTYPGATFEYDALGSVAVSTVDDVRRNHVYSATDERIATVSIFGTARPTAWTVRDPSGRVLRRFSVDNAGAWKWDEDYIYAGGGQLLAAEVSSPEKVRHFHLDHLGTPRLITGNGGAIIGQHTYYPFGAELTDPLQDGEKRKFTGHERDAATLDYMHARYYQTVGGRFLSVDPTWASADLGKPQTWNRYAYVMNNPVNHTDPTGKCADVMSCAPLMFGGGASGGTATTLTVSTGGTVVLVAGAGAVGYATGRAVGQLEVGGATVDEHVTDALQHVTDKILAPTAPTTIPAPVESRSTPQIGRDRPRPNEKYDPKPKSEPPKPADPNDPKQPPKHPPIKDPKKHELLDKIGDVLDFLKDLIP